MEAILFCGIQATGKSTFYQQHFFSTHVRISLDLLKTRNRESIFLAACFNTSQKLVIDNTNLLKSEREQYIQQAREYRFKVTGYYFSSNIEDAIRRNSLRTGKARIPEPGVRGAYKRLELPSLVEGFDELYYVTIEDNEFLIQNWKNEI